MTAASGAGTCAAPESRWTSHHRDAHGLGGGRIVESEHKQRRFSLGARSTFTVTSVMAASVP